MKSKLFKILGVITVVAMLASALVASPVFAATAVSAVTVTTTSAGGIISATGNYSIYATLTSQLAGTKSGSITLTAGQTFIVTETTTADQVFISGGVAALVPTLSSGAVIWTTNSLGGVVTFTGAGTATFTSPALTTTTGTYTIGYGNANLAAGTGTVGAATAALDSVTVTFPSTFTVAAPTATIAASTGWYAGPGAATPSFVSAVITSTSWTFSATLYTVTFTLAQGDYIGANSQILINITGGVTNPSTAGSYTLTVATSKDTTAVTSASFAISNPTPPAVAGVASVYNTAATPVLMTQSNSLATALTAAIGVAGGATIKLTAGTYADPTGTYTFPAGSVITIQGTDPSAANVIIQGAATWGITGVTVVVDSVTIDGTNGTFTISASKSGTLSNSIINNENTVTMTATGTGTVNVTKDTFTVKAVKYGLTAGSPVTVTGSTFNVTSSGIGIYANFDVTVSGCTFTGAANTSDALLGTGISFPAGYTYSTGSTIGTSTFTGLSNALIVNNAAAVVSFTGNTVTNCGQAVPPAATATPAITLTAASMLNIFGNTITNGTSNILTVASGYATNVNCTQNTFTGNANSVSSSDETVTTGIVNMARNWWGGAANVPANVTLVAGTTAGLQFTPALGGAPGTAAFVSLTASATNPIAASATVGVNVTASTGTGIIGATALAADPVAVAVPSPYTAVKFWDVYGTITTATIDFYGTTASPVTAANSALLWYNSVNGTWTNTNATANAFANYMEIMVGTTGNITAAQFGGTPFVLVTFPTTLGAPTPDAGTIFPVNGATGVAVSGVTFTWPIVTPPAGSTVTYQFALAQASANTSANEFAILDYSDNSITNAEPNQEVLQYSTVYWWEVRAVVMSSTGAITLTGPWTMSMFTTMPQPPPATTTATVAPVTPVTTIITTNVTSPVTTFTFPTATQTSSPTIPSYLLWAVIAVGAVLVIAVIVLIVRTRRIP